MKTYTLSEARKNFSEIIASVQKEGAQYAISVNGKPAATILSQEDYENLLETLEILQDQEIMQDIAISEDQYKKGEVIPLSEL